MINENAELTYILAAVFGLYMLAAGLPGLINPGRWQTIIDDLKDNAGLIYICGVLVYALGAVLVLVHNVWTDTTAIIVTIIGWAALLEGLILISWPKPLLALTDAVMSPLLARLGALFAVLLGAYLLAQSLPVIFVS